MTTGSNLKPDVQAVATDMGASPMEPEDIPLKVTVLLTAYNRVPFVPLALESACRQDLDPSRYEILVLSNRSEHRAVVEDARIRHPNARIRFEQMGESSIGEMLTFGFRSAHGKVVSLLNDDDEWSSEKLSNVVRAFEAHPRLVYFRNGLSVFRGGGSRPQSVSAVEGRSAAAVPRQRLLDGSNSGELARALRWTSIDFNDSSISVSREVVLRFSQEMRTLRTNEDTFLFYLAAISSGELLVTSVPLTKYRVHGNAMTQTTASGGVATWRRLAANDSATVASLDLLRSIARAQGRSDLLALIDHDREYSRLLAAARAGTSSRAETARQVVRFLPFCARVRIPAGMRALAWALCSLVSRHASRAGYLALRRLTSV